MKKKYKLIINRQMKMKKTANFYKKMNKTLMAKQFNFSSKNLQVHFYLKKNKK